MSTLMCCDTCGAEAYVLDENGKIVTCSKDVWDLCMNLRKKDVEAFEVLILNTRNMVLRRERIAQGGINAVHISPSELLKTAVMMGAVSIICVHNHPSGDTTPSSEDRALTDRLMRASNIMGIRFLDHIVVSGNNYYSFSDSGDI